MGAKKSFRVYLQTHHDGRITGLMLPAKLPIEQPPPEAYGATEADVLARLEVLSAARMADDAWAMEPYLWDTQLDVHTLSVEIHPMTLRDKRPVIGKARLPLKLTYAASRLKGGAWQIIVPRFGWTFVLEDLSVARDVLRQAVSSEMLGEHPRSLYDFRYEGEERVREWEPAGLDTKRIPAAPDHEPLPNLESVAEDLTERAARGKLPALVPPDAPLASGWPGTALTRQPRPSILLVGGPGVGKTTWVYHLAAWMDALRREKKQRTARVWRTSSDRILAGMVYLGMWQERCLKIAEELSSEGDFLYVDRLTNFIAPQQDGTSIADLLAPEAKSGSLALIAECTPEELVRCRRKAPDVVDAFLVVNFAEPAAIKMPALMERYLQAKRSGVSIHPSGLVQLTSYLQSFRKDSLFPGKAYRFLDWLCAQGEPGKSRTLYPRDVAEAYVRYSGLPLEIVSDETPADREKLSLMLKKGVVGQDGACDSAAGVLARLKSGLNDPEKPIGTFLFVGPTGVGKTELAKQLTRVLFGHEDRMIRLDMSEYQLPGSSRRLLEVGPGVSSLAERVRQQPLCLVLLDEIEKAHPEVFDLLLGVLGEGRLTDSLGRAVDFRMAIVVMTSNLGVTDSEPVGYGAETDAKDHLRAVREAFRPEFFNRLDHVLAFRRLALEDVRRIVDLELAHVAARTGLVRRGLTLRADSAARDWLAKKGFDPKMGARPLKRVIEESVVAPLAVKLSAGQPPGRDVNVVVGEAGLAKLDAGERELAIVLAD
ncbi:MAG TPA: AAA family ATPase [Myxococcales bacterium]|jgi:ATP-dependent Clp protease ATP-binding subunit ClpC